MQSGDEYAAVYPHNREPVFLPTGISKGYSRPAAGCVQLTTGPGIDRGGINWNGVLYRVMGTKLVRLSGAVVTEIGDVGAGGRVHMDYGFDRLIINSGTKLFYYDGINLTQVTDPDLGLVYDVLWIDGYTMTTDGNYIVVTELSDPTQVNPLKYGSAEADPDMITGLARLRGEVYAFGRYTVEVFSNAGTTGFPFQAEPGAMIERGCIGPNAKCRFADTLAFVGSSRDEPLGVHLMGSGTSRKISTRTIDDELAKVTDPTSIVVESRSGRNEQRLYLHLPDKSWVFLAGASENTDSYVWYSVDSNGPYRMRDAILVGNDWICGDLNSSALGILSDDLCTHFGDDVEWQFLTQFLYNGGMPGVIKSVELIGLAGRGPEGAVFFSMSVDGMTWGHEQALSTGAEGQRGKRMQWRPRRRFTNSITMRFRGKDASMATFAACEVMS